MALGTATSFKFFFQFTLCYVRMAEKVDFSGKKRANLGAYFQKRSDIRPRSEKNRPTLVTWKLGNRFTQTPTACKISNFISPWVFYYSCDFEIVINLMIIVNTFFLFLGSCWICGCVTMVRHVPLPGIPGPESRIQNPVSAVLRSFCWISYILWLNF